MARARYARQLARRGALARRRRRMAMIGWSVVGLLVLTGVLLLGLHVARGHGTAGALAAMRARR